MEQAFTAIDFETAQGKRWSICQVGLVRVENGKVKDQLSILVQPPQNYYWSRLTDIHGITSSHTQRSPTFDKVWNQIKPFVANQTIVAHNGFSFDFQCLTQALDYYSIAQPKFQGYCTYKIFGEKLDALCRRYNIPLNHHDALSDAMACARLYQLHLDRGR
jgi:DNA polymerase-3 subunit epsilon